MKPFSPNPRTFSHSDPAKLPQDGVLFAVDDSDEISDITLALAFERDQYLPALDITGGSYAALSLDNCFNCTLEGLTVDPRHSRHGIIVADHSDNVWLDGVLFDEHARGADIVIGWRPGLVPSSGWHRAGRVTLRDVRAVDRYPVRVHVWDAPPPLVIGGHVEVRLMNPRYVRAAQWLNAKGLLP